MMDILIGCGNSRERNIRCGDRKEWDNLVTVDIDPGCGADIIHDLNTVPLPFAESSANEIHAYNVLEHLGKQGDYKFFFEQFGDFWRILKPGGYFAAMVPCWNDFWAFGDPGHTRIINRGSLIFLDQDSYKDVGTNMMTDYRWCYNGNFKLLSEYTAENGTFFFILQAIK